MTALFLRAILVFLLMFAFVLPLRAEEWTLLAPGLELREFRIPDQAGDLSGQQGVMAAVRIDTEQYGLSLGTALSAGRMQTMQEWARTEGFVAVINAGMFRSDDRMRSTGFMRDIRGVVSGYMHPGYGAILAFQPKDPELPPVRWVDRKADPDWETVLDRYHGIIQNYRLISRQGENLWSQSERRHSAAAIAMDPAGRLLFIHSRPRLSLHEFAQALLDLPLDLIGAMYVEGGADAAMYVDANGFTGRWVGEYQSDFFQGSNRNFWPAPNVLGIRPK